MPAGGRRALDDQRRNCDGRKDMTHVMFDAGARDGERRARASREPLVPQPPFPKAGITIEGSTVTRKTRFADAPLARDCVVESACLIGRKAPWIVGCLQCPAPGVHQNQARCSLWMGRSEIDAHRAAIKCPEQHRALRAHGIQDGAYVIRPFLQRW
jgi:hypothetical protein